MALPNLPTLLHLLVGAAEGDGVLHEAARHPVLLDPLDEVGAHALAARDAVGGVVDPQVDALDEAVGVRRARLEQGEQLLLRAERPGGDLAESHPSDDTLRAHAEANHWPIMSLR